MPALRRAWSRIDKSNRGSSGSDGVTIDMFEKDLEANLRQISSQLRAGTYHFLASKGVLLDKPDGGKRPLKIGAIKDRVVCKSIALHIGPRLQKLDQDCSFAYRKNLSTANAIRRIGELFNSGSHWVLEADIQKFFDKVDREILKKKLHRVIKSEEYIDLIDLALTSEIHNPNNLDADYMSQFPAADSGIPQGNVLSPLLANFYLYPFDKAMLKKQFGLVRFADDFVVMCKSKEEAISAYSFAAKFLKEQLALTLHPLSKGGKSDVKKYRDGFEFLGFHVGGSTLKPSAKSIKKHQERIREIIREPLQASPLARKISRLNNVFKGWAEAFKNADVRDASLESEATLAEELSWILYRGKFLRRGDRLSHQQIKMLGVLTIRERTKKRLGKPAQPKTSPATPAAQ